MSAIFILVKKVFLLCFLSVIVLSCADNEKQLIIDDSLVSDEIVVGEASKVNKGGSFSEKGWMSESKDGFLKIEIEEGIGSEGLLEVKMNIDSWDSANLSSGDNGKIHFLNMFSNPNGDHHFEDGGTETDVLWTLRAGARDGKPRYGQSFKILYASKGAKRAPGSDYHEDRAKLPDNWEWKEGVYTVQVEWSKCHNKFVVRLNDQLFYEGKWPTQIEDFKYIMLGSAGDFKSMQRVYFSDLKLYRNNIQCKTSENEEIIHKDTLALDARKNFKLHLSGYAPFYLDKGSRSDYVGIDAMKYYNDWAGAKTLFQREGGNFILELIVYKEYDGEALYRIRINDKLLIQQQSSEISGKPEEGDETLVWENVTLNKGDTIIVEAKPHSNKKIPEEGAPGDFGWSRGRWKSLEIIKK